MSRPPYTLSEPYKILSGKGERLFFLTQDSSTVLLIMMHEDLLARHNQLLAAGCAMKGLKLKVQLAITIRRMLAVAYN